MTQSSNESSNRPPVDRRAFLQASFMSGALAIATPTLATSKSAHDSSEPIAPPEFELEEETLDGLREMMHSGQQTSRDLVKKYLERIADLNKKGPELGAVLEINPDAEAIADALDAELKAKGPRGQLHGIPILIKDNIDTADRMMTTAGSLALNGSIALRDAFVAQRLREAGAVLLGKTNLSEWANFRSTHSTSGWSGRGGQCRNPYALDRNPSGSSSGSAVAVAANLCAVAVGTETDGSIVSPSSSNGIVGIKPTLGLISRSGIIPIAHSQDTAGPMARTVRDAAILLGALAGIDSRDKATAQSQGKSHADYTEFLDPAGLRGARVGVARKFFGSSDKVDDLMKTALEAMRAEGAVLVDPVGLETSDKYGSSELEVLLYEFKADLNSYLLGLGPNVKVRSLKDIILFNDEHHAEEMPYFGQELFHQAESKGPLTSPAYRAALAKNQRLSRAQGIDAVMAKYRLDAIVAPTGGLPWLIDLIDGDYGAGGSTSPAAVAGYPSITVPAGYKFGLPVGISFFGKAYSEPTLLKIAYAFEQTTKVRRPPKLRATADLDDKG